jgi:hypothetical protein
VDESPGGGGVLVFTYLCLGLSSGLLIFSAGYIIHLKKKE